MNVILTLEGCALLFAVLAIPLWLRKVPRNIVYGYRTRKTLSDDAVWYDANANFGRNLFIASVISIVIVLILSRTHLFTPEVLIPVSLVSLVVPAAIAGIATAAYVRRLSAR